jgi:hypothetical protein
MHTSQGVFEMAIVPNWFDARPKHRGMAPRDEGIPMEGGIWLAIWEISD